MVTLPHRRLLSRQTLPDRRLDDVRAQARRQKDKRTCSLVPGVVP